MPRTSYELKCSLEYANVFILLISVDKHKVWQPDQIV